MSCGRFVSVLALLGLLAGCDEAPASSAKIQAPKSPPSQQHAKSAPAQGRGFVPASLSPQSGSGQSGPPAAVVAAPPPPAPTAAPAAPAPALRPNVWRVVPPNDALKAIDAALARGALPARAAVDLAALLAQFPVEMPAPSDGPLAVRATLIQTPWNAESWLLHVIVRGAEVPVPVRLQAALAGDDTVSLQFDPAVINRIRPIGGDRVVIGSDGSTAQAVYELTPQAAWRRSRLAARTSSTAAVTVLGTIRVHSRAGGADLQQQIELPAEGSAGDMADPDTRFAVALAAFAQVLRGDGQVRDFEYDDVTMLANGGYSADPAGRTGRLLQLIERAEEVSSAAPLDQPGASRD